VCCQAILLLKSIEFSNDHRKISTCADDLQAQVIPPAEAGGLFKPSLPTRLLLLNPTSGSWWIVQIQPTHTPTSPESHQRKLVDCSNPAYSRSEERLGLNNPPASAGGILWIALSVCRSGLNNPPASAGGIQAVRTGRKIFLGINQSFNSRAASGSGVGLLALDRMGTHPEVGTPPAGGRLHAERNDCREAILRRPVGPGQT